MYKKKPIETSIHENVTSIASDSGDDSDEGGEDPWGSGSEDGKEV
jgi:hypothetical protein